MNPKEKNQLIAEFRILKSLVHPNIVRYYQHEHVPELQEVHLYMEYCGGGDLASVIRSCKLSGELVPESTVWSVFTQMVLALYRCHYNCDPPPPGELFSDNGNLPQTPTTVILHRDIKPDNVFLDKNNEVKLGDFGLAKILDHDHAMLANTYVGTPYYMSPEVLLDKPYTPQSDIWSLGCVIYELCALHPPFQAKTYFQLSKKIQEGVYAPLPNGYSATLKKTIGACLNMNGLQRPTTATLLRLDVLKLCRKEMEVEAMKRSVQSMQSQLLAGTQDINKAINDEVERRLGVILSSMKKQQQHQQQHHQQHSQQLQQQQLTQNQAKPLNTHKVQSAHPQQNHQQNHLPYHPAQQPITIPQPVLRPSSPRNVKGPRTIKDVNPSPARSASPVKQFRFEEGESPSRYSKQFIPGPKSPKPTNYLDTNYHQQPHQTKYTFLTRGTNDEASASSASSVCSSSSSENSYESDSPRTTPRERQTLHFQAIFEAKKPVSYAQGFKHNNLGARSLNPTTPSIPLSKVLW